MHSPKPTPEPPHRAMLRRTSQALNEVENRLARLVIHESDGSDIEAPLAAAWQPLAGRPGVEIYHVPHPDGATGLYLAICRIAPGTSFEGSHIDQAQLVALLDGDLDCNGHRYRRGEFLWLAPGEPADWTVHAGFLAAILYDVPPHNIDPDLLPIT